jgi:hypothetical protein
MAGSSLPPSAAVTAIGVDHVRLLYAYLDAGELDGYASLTDEDVQLRGIGPRDTDGREDAVSMFRSWPPGTHDVRTIAPTGDGVTVVGRYTGQETTVDFADVFTLSDCGLIRSHRRIHWVPLG